MSIVRNRIVGLIGDVDRLIPREFLADLPPSAHTSGMPEWRGFEREIWERGEQIRQQLIAEKKLRLDEGLQDAYCRIACSRNAKNGRQPFFGLLGYTSCVRFAPLIAEQLDDYRVAGQAVSALLRMQADGFESEVAHLKKSEKAWIRNKANLYCERYSESRIPRSSQS